ncbi:aminotransferase class IV [Bythopirellula goksoeyrii]|uniref:branched-chain-amino-acid transaminase n=1 Tax=Bythopirellula goksoeyrii TaxID=1400387 RepID=A0A5B9QK05_9BACT|nr:aminotransferase class IV [Bythopirellula goksoeyrii]QEG34481.1 putative branched-chain-amino-acid aminotransferase [Bythopirellula goksoeyrii]
MNSSIAYLDGIWIPASQLSIAVDDLGFQMGVTLTERLRTFGGRPYRADEHFARLEHSLEIVGWDSKTLCREVSAAVEEFMDRNAEYVTNGDDWNIVVFITPGRSADASGPTVCVHGHPLPFQQWAHQFVQGVSASIADSRQVPANCWPSELKCRSRMHYYLAERQIQQASPDARAILLDQEGYVGEGTTANVIAYFGDCGLVTPRRDKVLPGVSQQVVFELAQSLGIEQQENDLLPAELAKADEIFFTSTSICLLPVVRLNELPIGTGKPGSIYNRLLEAWSQEVGLDIAAQAQKFAIR